MISNRRRRGQGMTEYIMLVGLIGILLVVAVTRFKNQIQLTIEGSAGAVDDMGLGTTGATPGGTPGASGTTYAPTTRNASDGRTIYTGSDGVDYVRKPGGGYEPAR